MRTRFGAVLLMMSLILGSAVHAATVTVTEDELFIADQSDTDRKQSFITYSGTNYRVMNFADWLDQAGVRVYQGRRHVKQDFS